MAIRCLILIFFGLTGLSHADSPVWVISKEGQKLYLGGTVHILTPDDYPLPDAFERAYEQADQVFFETDIAEMQSPKAQQLLLGQSFYTDGRSLETVLSKKTYAALGAHFLERGIPIDTMSNLKAGMVALTLTVIELQRLGLAGTGVDEFYSLKALQDGKEQGQLETIEQQIEFITTMGEGREDDLIRYSLNDLERLPELFQEMKQVWRSGDLDAMEVLLAEPIKTHFPELNQQINVSRNNAWLPKLEAMLSSDEVELVLVGALHLVGPDGLLAKLATRGYQIDAF